jgi:hypothetical protein
MRHHPLVVVFVSCVLLALLAGQGAAGAADAPLPAQAAGSQAAAALASGVGEAPQARDACAPQLGGWTIERPDSPKDLGTQSNRNLALDSAGHPHLVYGGDRLYYAWHDGTSWHREIVDPTLGVGVYASLALDDLDHPHVSYYDDVLNDMKYAHFDGMAWRIQTVDANLSDA